MEMEAKNKKAGTIKKLSGGLIVSCQAHMGEPLHGTGAMAFMALAAEQSGAVGIRADIYDLRDIRRITSLPIIGIAKHNYDGSEVIITPTVSDAEEVAGCGAELLAFDATDRSRPGGITAEEFIKLLRTKLTDIVLMADCATLEEGIRAAALGADLVSTTLSGYTSYTQSASPEPDYALIEGLARSVHIPVIAEGKIRRPEQAARCLEAGAYSVVVGGAITRPQQIAAEFSAAVRAAGKRTD